MNLFLSYYCVFNCEFLVIGDSDSVISGLWLDLIAFSGMCSENAISLFQIVPEEGSSLDNSSSVWFWPKLIQLHVLGSSVSAKCEMTACSAMVGQLLILLICGRGWSRQALPRERRTMDGVPGLTSVRVGRFLPSLWCLTSWFMTP